ncbi:UGSC family (seleno)protein [Rhabdothermincola salaria]|uniref:UGSC family (seleno)protein n=1 Tax=Rhabdothermincola salaria TaxID=2903142 RepID=UPI001E2A78A1|nr:hypothetical protein [Rhabdothermincola salaria]MCD9624682.1 hypothetical protein [Rhabdothermincola salaria]
MTLVYLPDSEPGPESVALAPSPPTLAGLRVAVLDNGKPNADVVMTAAAEALARRTGATVSVITKKGPRGESANAAVPCDPDIFATVVAEADLVITGAADCGSCTAYSVTDAIEFEKVGRPAVVATTTHFETVARTLSSSFGLPDTRLLVLPHPIGGTDAATLTAWAEAATDRLIALFTGAGAS